MDNKTAYTTSIYPSESGNIKSKTASSYLMMVQDTFWHFKITLNNLNLKENQERLIRYSILSNS
ncbi:MAG: hypothetical protein P0116_09890 [Candidatus Nitrosocosmicus sp.]|nr:hypothetical protein [Candidatus Nitrosocosmicus sp.]